MKKKILFVFMISLICLFVSPLTYAEKACPHCNYMNTDTDVYCISCAKGMDPNSSQNESSTGSNTTKFDFKNLNISDKQLFYGAQALFFLIGFIFICLITRRKKMVRLILAVILTCLIGGFNYFALQLPEEERTLENTLRALNDKAKELRPRTKTTAEKIKEKRAEIKKLKEELDKVLAHTDPYHKDYKDGQAYGEMMAYRKREDEIVKKIKQLEKEIEELSASKI